METYFITFRSVTYAQRGERMLMRHGISCYMQRTPRWMEEQGCGYALSLQQGQEAVEILNREGISWRKLYRKEKDGSIREEDP